MPDGSPLHVVIAGAGRAGLEAMFRLHRLAGPRARITLLARNEQFSNHALDVLLPFATPRPPRPSLATLAAAAGGQLHRGRVSSVDVDDHQLITDAGDTVAYDVLLLAVGQSSVRRCRTRCASAPTAATSACTASSRTSRRATCAGSRSSCPRARLGRWRSTSSR